MKIKIKHEIQQDKRINGDELLNIILSHRGVEDKESFLSPPSPLTISLLDFGEKYKEQFDNVIKLLSQIKKENRNIIVYTDYDADGITGGAILWETLHLLGFNVFPYVPNRHTEGYGFSLHGIDTVIAEHNPALIISVDHGITAREKIAYAKEKGVPIIVTDHHLKPEVEPDNAFALFHIPVLSGSAVSYFFSKEIYEYFKDILEIPENKQRRLHHNFSADYLTLASIGTIADLVPLIGPSRSVVKYGLDAAGKTDRCGLNHILKEAGIEGKKISPYEVGFIIAPRINAIGRLQHAMDALRLLCTINCERAAQLAGQMGNKNKERQDLVKDGVAEAEQQVVTLYGGKLPALIILRSNNWNEGIIGLIAAKITEKYYRPTIVMTKSDGFYKASARSIPALHMTDFLREHQSHLVDVGGHAAAAGFTIEEKQIEALTVKAQQTAKEKLQETDFERIIDVDVKLPLSYLSTSIVKKIEELYPFGVGNPQPVFMSDCVLLDAKLMGKKNEHLRLYLKDADKQTYPVEFVYFNGAEQFSTLSSNQKLSVIYSVEINRWGGNEKMQGKIVQIM